MIFGMDLLGALWRGAWHVAVVFGSKTDEEEERWRYTFCLVLCEPACLMRGLKVKIEA